MPTMFRRISSLFENNLFRYRFWGIFRLAGVFAILGIYTFIVGWIRESDSIAETLASMVDASFLLNIIPGLLPLYSIAAVFLTWQSLRYLFAPLSALIGVLLWSSFYVQDLNELKYFRSGLKYMIASLFGIGYPFLMVEDGKFRIQTDEENLLDKIGGPGFLIIQPGNVVLFESLRQPTNVRGEGFHFIPRHERVKEILDLEDHQGRIKTLSAVTKDGVFVTAQDVDYRYRLFWDGRSGNGNARSTEEPFPYSIQAVRNAVYNRSVQASGKTTSWPDTVRIMFEGDIQNYIREHQIDQVTAPREAGVDPRREIKNRYSTARLRNYLRRVGAHLIWFGIGKLDVEEPMVKDQRVSTWAAEWKGDADVIRAYGEAKKQSYMELGRAEANVEILLQIINALEDINLQSRKKNIRTLFLVRVSQVIYSLRDGGSQDGGDRIWKFLKSLGG